MHARWPILLLVACLLLPALTPRCVGAQGKSRDLAEVPSSTASESVPDRWAVVIGISKYQRSRMNLRYCADDAAEFAAALKKHCGFADDHIRLLVDEKAKAQEVRTALGSWLPRVAGPRDIVVIYFS